MLRVWVWSRNLNNEEGYRAIKKSPENKQKFLNCVIHFSGVVPDKRQARGGAVYWGIAFQAARLRVRIPIVLLDFFIDIFFPAAL